MLNIKNLHVSVENKKILKGVDLKIGKDEVHILMGPNGSGKSTLAQTLMGNPSFEVTKGKVMFEKKELFDLDPTARALAGVFLSFQYPSEIPGVSISNFLRTVYNKKIGEKLTPVKFRKLLFEKMKLLNIDKSFANRYLNEGFSGGEKKRMEILQMLVLEPKFAILDETDSGLDIDALKIVAKGVNTLKKETKMGVLVITHYARILKYIEPDFVHVMKDGKIVRSGGKKLAHELEEKGYSG